MYAGLQNQWFIACRSSQLRRRPVARTVLGQPLVLFRSGAGQAAALVDRCPHRNVPLSQGRVAAGRLAAPLIKLFFWQALRQDQRILRLQAANLRRFGEARYAYTALDLLGPHILRLLKHGPAPQAEPLPAKRVRLRM